MHVKRLDAQTIARQNKFAVAGIPDGESKHAAKFFDETFAIFLVEMKDDFGVRRGAEGMAALFEFAAQFGGVVSFAVVGDPGLAIGAGHGHAPAVAQVDNGESRVDQETGWKFLDALAVRAAMFHGGSHALGGWTQRIVRVCGGNPGDAAHAAYLPSSATRQRGNSAHVSGNGDGLRHFRKLWASGTRLRSRATSRRYSQSSDRTEFQST